MINGTVVIQDQTVIGKKLDIITIRDQMIIGIIVSIQDPTVIVTLT